MPLAATRPDEVYASLAAALGLQSGFGLCVLFSDDFLGLTWLQNRLKEHVQTSKILQSKRTFRRVDAVDQDSIKTIQKLAVRQPGQQDIVWCQLPATPSGAQQFLSVLNEQRQRLIAAGHFYVMALPAGLAHDAPAWAPDLWAIRTLVFQAQNDSRWVAMGAGPAGSAQFIDAPNRRVPTNTNKGAKAADSAVAPTTSPLIANWRRIYAAWQAAPELTRPAVDLALQASHHARLTREFGDAVLFATQAAEVAGNDLGRANALIALGDLKSLLGAVDEALALYIQAIALFEKEQDDLGRANALQALGDLKSRLGAVDEALALYTQAIALYEKEQDDLGLGYCWAELARIWRTDSAKVSQARDAAKKALAHAAAAGAPPALAQIIQSLVDIGLADPAGFVIDNTVNT